MALLFGILEEFCHPIRFDGDLEKVHEVQDYISNLLRYDGYCFKNNKIAPVEEAALKELDARTAARKAATENLPFGPFSDLFDLIPQREPVKEPIKQKEVNSEKLPFNIIINNSNVQNHEKAYVAEQEEASSYSKKVHHDESYDLIRLEGGAFTYRDKLLHDFTGLQSELIDVLYSKPKNHVFKTVDIEDRVYGADPTKQRQENLKKLVQNLNEKFEKELGVTEFIKYTTNTIIRLK